MAARAVILLGHGSRDPQWKRPLESVAERMRSTDSATPVRCAYLELDRPDLATAAAELVRGGARELHVLPLFLGLGRHAREDLPRLAEAVRLQHPGVTLELRPPVGEDARVLDLLARLAAE